MVISQTRKPTFSWWTHSRWWVDKAFFSLFPAIGEEAYLREWRRRQKEHRENEPKQQKSAERRGRHHSANGSTFYRKQKHFLSQTETLFIGNGSTFYHKRNHFLSQKEALFVANGNTFYRKQKYFLSQTKRECFDEGVHSGRRSNLPIFSKIYEEISVITW